MIYLIICLIFSHYLCDFALQSSYMAKMKSKLNDVKQKLANDGMYGDQVYQMTWFYVLSAHAIIHGGVVYLLTGYVEFFFITMITHGIIDKLKTSYKTNIHQDQFLHHLVILIEALIACWS